MYYQSVETNISLSQNEMMFLETFSVPVRLKQRKRFYPFICVLMMNINNYR